MGKKRKAPRPTEPSGPREVDSKDARLNLRGWEDVADSEDEHYANQDRIDFDDEPRSKRARQEDDFLEPSDDEVFAGDQSSDESEDEEDVDVGASSKGTQKRKAGDVSDEEGRLEDEEEEGDSGFWGSSRKDYYDGDKIETEADALEEEAEARRLQQKKFSKLTEDDFAFDESAWLQPTDATDGGLVTEVLGDLEIPEDLEPEERYKILQARYPEFDLISDELQSLQPLLAQLQKSAEGKSRNSLEVAKYWVLGSYLASLVSYFVLLSSPVRDDDSEVKLLDASELRDHEVMSTLNESRTAWLNIKDLKPNRVDTSGSDAPRPHEDDIIVAENDSSLPKKAKKLDKVGSKALKATKKAAADKARQAKAVEESLADLSGLIGNSKIRKTSSKQESTTGAAADDDDSDFGEEGDLDSRTAADKAARKRSLRFYTSQIVQKASRRAGAGRDAGGDMDIPYRERLKDRQARLNAEAERRGRKSEPGAELGEQSSDEEDNVAAKAVKEGEDDEYYDMVAAASSKKKQDKNELYAAYAAAKKGERIIENGEVGEDGKRKISWSIQKNKGLMGQRRKKENRNPRVKKRMKFAEKTKKLKSMRPVYQGGEGRGGYAGETSGIKAGLVRSVKL